MSEIKLQIKNLMKAFGQFHAVDQINLNIEKGKLYSLLGPSGCGKTTTLRMIAGLETPTFGEIIVDGCVLSDSKHVTLPEKRNMSMVFQSYAVWPHMTVFDNVGYGLKIKRIEKSKIKKKVQEALDLVGMGELGERFPTQLSGGQQQRVALARALVNEPEILLLDEPLSNLDAKLRENMRFEIRQLQQRLGITAIYVTHSQEEALAVSDEIVIMRSGKVLQQGLPEEIYAHPNSCFVAGFIGLVNEFNARILGIEDDGYEVQLDNGNKVSVAFDGKRWKIGDQCKLLVRPENFMFNAWDKNTRYNTFYSTIENVSFTGSIVNYFIRVAGIGASYRIQAIPPVLYSSGSKVECHFAPSSCVLVEN